MKKITSCVIVLILTISLFSSPQETYACSPVFKTPQENFNTADAIFVGTVFSVASSSQKEYFIDYTGKVYVAKTWKGNLPTTVNIISHAFYTCGSGFNEFDEGKSRLIYATKATSTNTYYVGMVDMKDIEYSETDIALLNSGVFSSSTPAVTFTRNLTLGSSGPDVIKLQELLEQKGFLKMPQGVAKGYFGALTRNAVIKFQKSKGIIPAVGFFGKVTQSVIIR